MRNVYSIISDRAKCRQSAMGEAAGHVPLASGHVVPGPLHEEGHSTAA